MKERCLYCYLDADFIVQWGPEADQKKSACSLHIEQLLSEVPAPEMWVVKVKKA